MDPLEIIDFTGLINLNFYCTSDTDDIMTVQWLVTGELVQDPPMDNITVQKLRNRLFSLTLPTVPNNTRVQCMGNYAPGRVVRSEIATVTFQGTIIYGVELLPETTVIVIIQVF